MMRLSNKKIIIIIGLLVIISSYLLELMYLNQSPFIYVTKILLLIISFFVLKDIQIGRYIILIALIVSSILGDILLPLSLPVSTFFTIIGLASIPLVIVLFTYEIFSKWKELFTSERLLLIVVLIFSLFHTFLLYTFEDELRTYAQLILSFIEIVFICFNRWRYKEVCESMYLLAIIGLVSAPVTFLLTRW